MIPFEEYITEAKNTHMTHLEDLILDGGVNGTRGAISALISLRNMLSGHSDTRHSVTVKWDGAPAVFAGIDPSDGEFFVAKKGIFNKNPKVYKSHEDIDADTSGDLSKKLKIAYTELKKLGISDVIQGDIMFTKSDIKKQTIHGEKYVTFHPNTIVYAVPIKQADPILGAKIGVVWHTKYTGSSFEDMSASFNVDITGLKKTPSVWMRTADLEDLSGTVTMTEKETLEVTSHLSAAGKIFNKISATTLNDVSSNADINRLINTFNNTKVRSQEKITNPKKHTSELVKWIENKCQVEIDKLKSVKGKDRRMVACNKILSFFDKSNVSNLILMFELQNHLVMAKEILIKKFNEVSDISTFVKTNKGFKLSGTEGYVAIDREGSAVKLVDRMEFSANNFSSDIIKGWQK